MKRSHSIAEDTESSAAVGGGDGGDGGGDGGGGQGGRPAVRARKACPLIGLLDGGVKEGVIVKLDVERGGAVISSIYTGFADFRDLERSNVLFIPMNSNRAVNPRVVAERVASNEAAYARHGRYLEFGQINLLVLRDNPQSEFLVMDGQHRCVTMKELCGRYPDRILQFQFRAKVRLKEGEGREERKK